MIVERIRSTALRVTFHAAGLGGLAPDPREAVCPAHGKSARIPNPHEHGRSAEKAPAGPLATVDTRGGGGEARHVQLPRGPNIFRERQREGSNHARALASTSTPPPRTDYP